MLPVHAQTTRSPPILPESPRSSLPQTAARAAAKDDVSLAQTTPCPSRSRPAAAPSNLSPPPSESAGSFLESKRALPQCVEIHTVLHTLPVAADSPAASPAAGPPAAPTASNDPNPPAFGENQTPLPSSLSRLLPPNQTPSAAAPESLRQPACSPATHPTRKLPAFSNL